MTDRFKKRVLLWMSANYPVIDGTATGVKERVTASVEKYISNYGGYREHCYSYLGSTISNIFGGNPVCYDELIDIYFRSYAR